MRRCPNPDCPDVILFGVVGEYGPSITACPKCGEILVEVPTATPDPSQQDDSKLPDPEPEVFGPYSYVASFRDWGPAQLARSYLTSCGVHARLLDENMVALRWTHSQAVFGFKLVVSGMDGNEARKLLADDRSADLFDVPESALPSSPYDTCPRCRSEKVIWPKLERRCKALSLFFLWFLLVTPVAAHFQPTRCHDCGHRWFPQWDTGTRDWEEQNDTGKWKLERPKS